MSQEGLETGQVGQCLCGAVRFTVASEMSIPNACHCIMCRRWHGAWGVYSSAELAEIALTGTEHIAWYRSSADIERGFCRHCGSKLFWRGMDDADLDIAVGAFEIPTGLKIGKHIWVAFKGDYYDIEDDLPQYAHSSENAEPIKPAPPLPDLPAKPTLHNGQCLCGAIHLTITGPMRDISVCHCGQCRRWHGHAPGYSKARWADIAITGREHLRWFQSSPEARRGFCDACGSSLFWEVTGGDAVAVAAGILDSPTGLRERHHIFVAHKGDCYDIVDNLPQYPASGAALPF
jgi:hypothetical protein